MKLYMLGKGVAKYYRKNVKENSSASDNLIQKKLTRNIKLAKKYQLANNENLYLYGNLLIFVKGNKITKLYNIKGSGIKYFKPNKGRYEQLNNILGISKKNL